MANKKALIICAVVGLAAIIGFLSFKYFSTNTTPAQDAQAIYLYCHDQNADIANAQRSNKELCYQKAFANLADKFDMRHTLSTLSDLKNIDSSTNDCHLIAHAIASAEVLKNPQAWLDVLKNIDAYSCNGGYIHGAIEAKSISDRNFKLDRESIDQICKSVQQAKGVLGGLEQTSCVHIMGHLALVDRAGNIPQAVQICAELSSISDQGQCYSGIFMESELRDNLVAHGLSSYIPFNAQTTKQQEDLCRNFTGMVGETCWGEISLMYAVALNDPAQIYASCSISPFSRDGVCYDMSMGALGIAANTTPDQLGQLCHSIPNPKQFNNCISYVINHMLLTSLQYTNRTIAVCNNLPENQSKNCFISLGKKLQKLASGTDLQKLCNDLPTEYIDQCLGSKTVVN